jgi:hypothetical protein
LLSALRRLNNLRSMWKASRPRSTCLNFVPFCQKNVDMEINETAPNRANRSKTTMLFLHQSIEVHRWLLVQRRLEGRAIECDQSRCFEHVMWWQNEAAASGEC